LLCWWGRARAQRFIAKKQPHVLLVTPLGQVVDIGRTSDKPASIIHNTVSPQVVRANIFPEKYQQSIIPDSGAAHIFQIFPVAKSFDVLT
jgi:hypothetical protein